MPCTGHSVGGQLVTRTISVTSPLPEQIRARVRNTVLDLWRARSFAR